MLINITKDFSKNIPIKKYICTIKFRAEPFLRQYINNNMEELLTANNIVKSYNNFIALNHVNMNIQKGSIFGLLGPNGAGKTSLIRIINRITAPDKGEIIFKGRALQPGDIYDIGYLPEERGLYKKMKVGEHAIYMAQLKGLHKHEAVKRIKHWFEKFEIQGWWDKKVEELSKGMQQKLQFIITVIHQPELLIFDEPFSGFDPINTNLIKNEILRMKEEGSTIIFSTHNMGSVEELCDDICLINKADNILSGNIQEIKERHKSNKYRIIFRGDPEKLKLVLNSNFEILETKEKGEYVYETIVKIFHQSDQNQLLSLILPAVHIIIFEELVPSMNEIFIQEVQKQN